MSHILEAICVCEHLENEHTVFGCMVQKCDCGYFDSQANCHPGESR